MLKPVNWVTQLWHGRVSPGCRAVAVIATIIINGVVMMVLVYGIVKQAGISPSVID